MTSLKVYDVTSKFDIAVFDKIYQITDSTCNFYPKHKKWFYQKFIPNIINGTRIIVAVFNDDDIPIGTAFLKKISRRT